MGLLFKRQFHPGLVDGSITLTFRTWSRPQVKPGGRYRCHPIGVLEVIAIDEVTLGSIRDTDARRSGFGDAGQLVQYLTSEGGVDPDPKTRIYRVELKHAGDEDARPIAYEATLSADDMAAIRTSLDRMDARSEFGAWTRRTLELIAEHPHRRAGDLADLMGREKLEFKKDVVKLKKLGLTMSHEVGYSLSPRGTAFLAGKAGAGKDPEKEVGTGSPKVRRSTRRKS